MIDARRYRQPRDAVGRLEVRYSGRASTTDMDEAYAYDKDPWT